MGWLFTLALLIHHTFATPTFVLIGGGLKDDNAAVYTRLLERRESHRVVIVPYASAEPDVAAHNAIGAMKKHRADVQYVVLPDPAKDAASREEAARLIEGANLVYFTGGDQSRLMPRFFERAGEGERWQPTSVMRALRAAAEQGTIIGGTSAGAAVMGDPMFTGGGSESALAGVVVDDEEKEPAVKEGAGAPQTHVASPGLEDSTTPSAQSGGESKKKGVQLGQGFGLVQGVIIDTHTGARGRVGRMLAAIQASGRRFALGVNENRAVMLCAGRWTAIGDEAAFVLDWNCGYRGEPGWRHARLWVMSEGDVVEVPSDPQGSIAYQPALALPSVRAIGPGRELEFEGAWSKGVLSEALRALAIGGYARVVLRGDRVDAMVTFDSTTRFFMGEGGEQALRAERVIFGVSPVKPTAVKEPRQPAGVP